jgi:hypothetical protein
LTIASDGHKLTDVKTISTRRFTRGFPELRHEPCLVTDRGKVIGSWSPVPNAPVPVNFAERVKEDFAHPLPFTGVDLLKAGKKRFAVANKSGACPN